MYFNMLLLWLKLRSSLLVGNENKGLSVKPPFWNGFWGF